MERMFDKVSLIRTLKDGIKKGYWTMKHLDTPPPGWRDCVNDCEGNPAFPQGYQGIKYKNLAKVSISKPKKVEEKVEIIDPKDLPIKKQK